MTYSKKFKKKLSNDTDDFAITLEKKKRTLVNIIIVKLCRIPTHMNS